MHESLGSVIINRQVFELDFLIFSNKKTECVEIEIVGGPNRYLNWNRDE